MSLKLSYSTLGWQNPDLEPALEALKKAGWDGWEGRLPLDWLGTTKRLRQVCENTDMPMVVYTAGGSPDNREWENVERNKRRMEYAAEMEVDCFMFMSGGKPANWTVNADDIKNAAEGAEVWAEYAAQYGLEISYHIHTNTLIDSTEDWRLYMSLLDKTKLCIDVSHTQLWGYDPVESIQEFRGQLNYIHLQDYFSSSRGEAGNYDPVWCDVGEGEYMDFPKILKALEGIGFTRWVTSCPGVPHPQHPDSSTDAERSKRTRQYLKNLGY